MPTTPSPTTLPRKLSFLRRIIRFFVVLYLGWCLALYFLQDRMLFMAAAAGPGFQESRIPSGTHRIWISLTDGSRIEAWFYSAATASESSPASTVIYAHGNAELIDQQESIVKNYTSRGINVLLAEYPGYGRSTGSPSQSTITEALEKLHAQLIMLNTVDPKRLIYHGRSLGTGAVAQLAHVHPPIAMVFESPFRSVSSFCWRYGVPPFIAKNPFRTDEVLKSLNVPVVILHGTSDITIPIEHSRALVKINPHAVLVELDATHNDDMINSDPRAWTAIDSMLQTVGATSPAKR